MCVLIGLGYLARISIAALRAPESGVPVKTLKLVTAGLPRVRAGVGARSGHDLPATGGQLRNGGANVATANGAVAHAAARHCATANGALPDVCRAARNL